MDCLQSIMSNFAQQTLERTRAEVLAYAGVLSKPDVAAKIHAGLLETVPQDAIGGHFVTLVAFVLDNSEANKNVNLVEQYKHWINTWNYEIPSRNTNVNLADQRRISGWSAADQQVGGGSAADTPLTSRLARGLPGYEIRRGIYDPGNTLALPAMLPSVKVFERVLRPLLFEAGIVIHRGANGVAGSEVIWAPLGSLLPTQVDPTPAVVRPPAVKLHVDGDPAKRAFLNTVASILAPVDTPAFPRVGTLAEQIRWVTVHGPDRLTSSVGQYLTAGTWLAGVSGMALVNTDTAIAAAAGTLGAFVTYTLASLGSSFACYMQRHAFVLPVELPPEPAREPVAVINEINDEAPLEFYEIPRKEPLSPEEMAARINEMMQAADMEGAGVVGKPTRGITCHAFHIDLPAGVGVNRLTSRTNDLRVQLAVPHARVGLPREHGAYLRIEVPRPVAEWDDVSVALLLKEAEPLTAGMKLPLVLGRDVVTREPVVRDLAEFPHFGVAGTSGGGKTFGLYAMLIGLHKFTRHEDTALYYIDMKAGQVLGRFFKYDHCPQAVAGTPDQGVELLSQAVAEMEWRYRYDIRDVEDFNRSGRAVPYDRDEDGPILSSVDSDGFVRRIKRAAIFMDEFADMMDASAETRQGTEEYIARLARKGRECGIHVVPTTQRPTKDVLTGKIKANISVWMCYRVTTEMESRIALMGQQGAEGLGGKGEFLLAEASGITRGRTGFADEKIVTEILG